jgi:hypothetical protein
MAETNPQDRWFTSALLPRLFWVGMAVFLIVMVVLGFGSTYGRQLALGQDISGFGIVEADGVIHLHAAAGDGRRGRHAGEEQAREPDRGGSPLSALDSIEAVVQGGNVMAGRGAIASAEPYRYSPDCKRDPADGREVECPQIELWPELAGQSSPGPIAPFTRSLRFGRSDSGCTPRATD